MNTDSPSHAALRQAVERLGSQTALAALLGLTQQSVSGWMVRGGVLPAEHVLKVEAATGISRHVLRPDIYPIEPARVDPAGSISPHQSSGAGPGEAPPAVATTDGARVSRTRAA